MAYGEKFFKPNRVMNLKFSLGKQGISREKKTRNIDIVSFFLCIYKQYIRLWLLTEHYISDSGWDEKKK